MWPAVIPSPYTQSASWSVTHEPGVQCIKWVYTVSWVVDFLLRNQSVGEEYYPNRAKLLLSWGLLLLLLSPATDSKPACLTDRLKPGLRLSLLVSLRVKVKWLSADPPPPPVQVSATVTYRKPSRTLPFVRAVLPVPPVSSPNKKDTLDWTTVE